MPARTLKDLTREIQYLGKLIYEDNRFDSNNQRIQQSAETLRHLATELMIHAQKEQKKNQTKDKR